MPSLDTFIIGGIGAWYEGNMQAWFGDYRFSHTIEKAHGGEPAWLAYLHNRRNDYISFWGL